MSVDWSKRGDYMVERHGVTNGRVVTVLTLTREGTTYGVNGWPASDTDIAKYLTRKADQ